MLCIFFIMATFLCKRKAKELRSKEHLKSSKGDKVHEQSFLRVLQHTCFLLRNVIVCSLGIRMYGVEVFQTLPIISANWKVGTDRPRAHSRLIQISFSHHDDEPEANRLFAEMTHCREEGSRSIGLLVR